MKVGILEFQGDIEEHFIMTKKAMENLKISGDVISVKKNSDMKKISALIIPGGESTVIGEFIKEQNLNDEIKKFAKKKPIMGTCAGAILLAKECNDKRINLLRLMEISISRNAYGRQVDSFETDLDINGISKFNCIFIRAPIIEKISSDKVKVLAEFNGKPIFVQQGKILALTFHPELTNDTRVHEYFLRLI